MQLRIAALSCGLILAGAGGVHAQGTPVESRLTFALQIDMTDLAGNEVGDVSTNIDRVSFSTKDLIDLVSDITENDDIRNVALRRLTSNEARPDADLLGEDLVFLDSDGNVVPAAGAIVIEQRRVLAALDETFAQRAADIRDDDMDGIVSRDDRSLEAGTLRIVGDGNNLEFGLIGNSRAESRRRSDGDRDLGLIFNSRVIDVTGGAQLDVASSDLDDALDGNGVVTGTIRASSEQRLDD
jgi:hypothetical protein